MHEIKQAKKTYKKFTGEDRLAPRLKRARSTAFGIKCELKPFRCEYCTANGCYKHDDDE